MPDSFAICSLVLLASGRKERVANFTATMKTGITNAISKPSIGSIRQSKIKAPAQVSSIGNRGISTLEMN